MDPDEGIKDDEAAFEEPEPDKTEEETPENEGKKPAKEKPRSSEIAQKIKWRERALTAEANAGEITKLKEELENLKGLVKKPENDQEAKAQEYIREQARKVYEELQSASRREEERNAREFASKVASVLEENPDVSEEEILDVIEELEVEPEVALKVLRRGTPKKEKPRMPTPKRASAEESETKKYDDKDKTMFQVLQDELKNLRNK